MGTRPQLKSNKRFLTRLCSAKLACLRCFPTLSCFSLALTPLPQQLFCLILSSFPEPSLFCFILFPLCCLYLPSSSLSFLVLLFSLLSSHLFLFISLSASFLILSRYLCLSVSASLMLSLYAHPKSQAYMNF